MELINITYNLADKIQEELESRQLVAVVNDESLKLAREERAGLNKFIGGIDKQRTAFKKEIDTRFKAEMECLTSRLAEFDKNIEEYDNARKEAREAEIHAYFDSLNSGLNYSLMPTAEWVASYPAFKNKVDLTVNKIKAEITIIATQPQLVKNTYMETYDLARALASQPIEQPQEPMDMPILKVFLNAENKDKVINYLNALGVYYEQIS